MPYTYKLGAAISKWNKEMGGVWTYVHDKYSYICLSTGSLLVYKKVSFFFLVHLCLKYTTHIHNLKIVALYVTVCYI